MVADAAMLSDPAEHECLRRISFDIRIIFDFIG